MGETSICEIIQEVVHYQQVYFIFCFWLTRLSINVTLFRALKSPIESDKNATGVIKVK